MTVIPLVEGQITKAVIDDIYGDAVPDTDAGGEHGNPDQHAKSLPEHLAW